MEAIGIALIAIGGLTVADLVRNEVFAQSSDDAERAKNLFETRWEPFVARFEDKNADLDRFLFPYGLVQDPNIKKGRSIPSVAQTLGRL